MKFEKLSTFLLMLFLLSSFASALNPASTTHYWTFDTDGADSLETLNMTVTGATQVAGVIGNQYSYDGNDYLSGTGTNYISSWKNGVYTIWGWVNATNVIGSKAIYSEGTNNDLDYGYFYLDNNKLGISVRGSSTSDDSRVVSDNTLTAEETFVVAVVNGSFNKVDFYINNVKSTSTVELNESENEPSINRASIGSRYRASQDLFFNGEIDEVGIAVGKAFNANNVSELWNAGNANQYPYASNNFTITAKDKYDNFIINEFDVDLNGTIYNITGGQLITPINYTTLVNISISKAGYFEINYTDYNTSTNLIAELPSLVNKEVKIYNDIGNLTSMACLYNDAEYNGSSFNVSTYLVTNLTFFCQQNSLYKSAEITLTDDNLTQNITLVPQSLDITVFNEITLNKIEQDIDVLIQDNFTERNFTLINGTGIITGINETDIYRLVFNTTGYESRVLRFDTSQGFSSQLNIYLQPTTNINVQDVTIRIVDSRGYDIDSARIQIFVYINGTKTKIEDQLTDITGSITAPLDIEKRHFFEISKDNYATRSFVVNNPLTTSYTFSLQDEIQTDFDNELNGILYSYDPGKGVLIYNRSYIFNWSVSSPYSELSTLYAQRFIIYDYNESGDKVATYYETSTDPAGVTLQIPVDLGNKINHTIEFIFCFKKDGYSEYCLGKKLIVLQQRINTNNLYGIRDYVSQNYTENQRIIMWLFAWVCTSILIAAIPFMRNLFIVLPIMLFGLFFGWLLLPISYLAIIGVFLFMVVVILIGRYSI